MFTMRNYRAQLLGLLLTFTATTTVFAQGNGNIVERLSGIDGSQALIAAVLVVDESMTLDFSIAESLSGIDNLVLLAPTNPAFESLLGLDSGFLDGLTVDEIKAALPGILDDLGLTVGNVVDILLLHVGQVEAASSGELLAAGAVTVAGDAEPLAVSLGSKGVRVNYEASVVLADVAADNGVIHFIDTVLVGDVLQ